MACIMTTAQDVAVPSKAMIPCPSVRKVSAFRRRGLFGAIVLGPAAALVLLSRPVFVGKLLEEQLFYVGGWFFFLVYMGWRLWATLFIGGRKDRELQTEGPYSVCRNPLYFGSFCYSLSIACFLGSLSFGVAVLAVLAVYCFVVIRAEEHSLELRFGEDYRNYCRRTPRLWPRWSSFHSPGQVQVDLKRLKQECIRLTRAATLPLLLQVITHLRLQPFWPHWFGLL